MTLIIGAKCIDGVVLVSDKKITDTNSYEQTYRQKLFFPIAGISVVVGAAGFTRLFQEFNSKLPDLVNQRQIENRIKNIEALARMGETIEQYEQPVQEPQEIKEANDIQAGVIATEIIEKKQTEKSHRKLPRLPYEYTIHEFLDDCRELIKSICVKSEAFGSLDVLIAVFSNVGPKLYHVDFRGQMEEGDVFAIGSGSLYWPLIKEKWNPELFIIPSIKMFYFLIKLVEDLKFDNFVGLGNEQPDVKIVANDGKTYIYSFPDDDQTMTTVKEYVGQFKATIDAVKL